MERVRFAANEERYHLAFDSDYVTYCGRVLDGKRITRERTSYLDIDDPTLCRLCRRKALT
jgi:hypothetical protein